MLRFLVASSSLSSTVELDTDRLERAGRATLLLGQSGEKLMSRA